jgi:hypothetical protein
MSYSKAQQLLFQGDARSQGMANARVMLANQWSGLNNSSGLAGVKATSFGLYYANYFQVPELGVGAFSFVIPTSTGTYAVSYAAYGYSLFRQSHAVLSYGKAFGNIFRAGIGLHYLMIRQSYDYGTLYAFVPSLGIQLLPLTGLTVGVDVFNPAVQHYIPSGYQDIPAVIRAGIGYNLGNEVLICAEVEKASKEKAKCYGGVEITLQKMVLMRLGFSSGEFPGFSFGIGFQSRHLKIDVASARHPVLGFSSALGIAYAMK